MKHKILPSTKTAVVAAVCMSAAACMSSCAQSYYPPAGGNYPPQTQQDPNYGYQDPSNNGQDPTVDFQTFYDDLTPYGQWIDNPQYGQVWVPSQTDFSPYNTGGHWEYTMYGWTWVSDYDWGWAPFHYGRWNYDAGFGWEWVPGYEWAPAWVNWRTGGDFYGWAPLGPGMRIGVGVGFDIPYSHYTFVNQRYINAPNIRNYYVARNQNINIYSRTTVINNYNQFRNARFNPGPDRRDVERFTGRPIQAVAIHSASRPGRTYVGGGGIQMYRPSVRPGTTFNNGNRGGYNNNGGGFNGGNDRFNNGNRGGYNNNNGNNDRFNNGGYGRFNPNNGVPNNGSNSNVPGNAAPNNPNNNAPGGRSSVNPGASNPDPRDRVNQPTPDTRRYMNPDRNIYDRNNYNRMPSGENPGAPRQMPQQAQPQQAQPQQAQPQQAQPQQAQPQQVQPRQFQPQGGFRDRMDRNANPELRERYNRQAPQMQQQPQRQMPQMQQPQRQAPQMQQPQRQAPAQRPEQSRPQPQGGNSAFHGGGFNDGGWRRHG